MRVVVRQGFSRDMADMLLNDIKNAICEFEKLEYPTPTLNPATAPESACAGLVWAPVLKVELSTLAMELVILERSCVPP